ncbi:MAG: hypothetical protein R3E89_15760, partial [Thiolinea sp.]
LTDGWQGLEPQDGVFDLDYGRDPQTGQPLKPRFRMSLQLNNQCEWPEDVHVSLLFLDPVTGSVIDLIRKPGGEILRQQERVGPDKQVRRVRTDLNITKANYDSVIKASIPQVVLAAGMDFTTDYLKLFISNFPLDVSSLTQPSLNQLLDSNQRSGDLDEDQPAFYRARTRTFVLRINALPPQEGAEETGPDERVGEDFLQDAARERGDEGPAAEVLEPAFWLDADDVFGVEKVPFRRSRCYSCRASPEETPRPGTSPPAAQSS